MAASATSLRPATPGTTETRVTEIRWDPGRGVFDGLVAVSHPAGVSMARVSARGLAGWDHARVRAALAAAGHARGVAPPDRARCP